MLQNNLIIIVHSPEQCFGSGFTESRSGPGHLAETGSKLLLDPNPIRIRMQTQAFEDKENVF
jgi:hypothetical protein